MSRTALFQARDDRFVAHAMTRGPWDEGSQHGGAPAALLMRALEALPRPEGLAFARVTYELLRPVPVGEVLVQASVVRPGRRVQLLEASLSTDAGVEVVRARALQVARAQTGGSDTGWGTPPAGPEDARPSEMRPRYSPMFAPDAIEIRFAAGRFGGGPSTGWFRLQVPVVEGEPPSQLQRLAAAADFGNGTSAPLSWDDFVFINPDLTIYIEREPVGEWIALQSETRLAPAGVGVAESVLFDRQGRVGRATQALYVAPR